MVIHISKEQQIKVGTLVTIFGDWFIMMALIFMAAVIVALALRVIGEII
jgi:hypothetical protein